MWSLPPACSSWHLQMYELERRATKKGLVRWWNDSLIPRTHVKVEKKKPSSIKLPSDPHMVTCKPLNIKTHFTIVNFLPLPVFIGSWPLVWQAVTQGSLSLSTLCTALHVFLDWQWCSQNEKRSQLAFLVCLLVFQSQGEALWFWTLSSAL